MPASIDLSFLRSRAALKRIAVITVASAALGALYCLVAPKWYRSVLTVVPAKQQKGGGLSSLLGGELSGLAGLDVGGAAGGADAPRIAAVLESIAVTDAVIAKFDLRTRYDESYQEAAREELWRHCSLKTLPKPGLVKLTCEDKDPRFVQELLAYFAEHGNQVFRRVSVSSASEEVRFLEKRVGELRQQAADTSARMREYQEKYQIVDLDTQAKAVVSALAAINGQRITKQLELGYARAFASNDEATTQQLQSQLGILDEKLNDLGGAPPPPIPAAEAGSRRRGASSVFPAAMAVPKLRAEFETLYRDRKVAEATLIIALERLESARATEARDVSTFLVLDPPTLPTRHSRPRRLVLVLALATLGLGAGVAWEWWTDGRRRNGPSAPVVTARADRGADDRDAAAVGR
jgi:capsule polysaccharide export protein KpsE/RkpR